MTRRMRAIPSRTQSHPEERTVLKVKVVVVATAVAMVVAMEVATAVEKVVVQVEGKAGEMVAVRAVVKVVD
jgi:hypothetical protein